eukprot:TRINITY_DN22103_c0_g2_i1.p1 TRINITY_DN22103_c0_g2~~TRINITY_DN22103_c0_g2_i1.p1  ORF type:complete len:370 (-),score=75.41 TRINITY_DN22103_c0_g2_i1:152-1150(-)
MEPALPPLPPQSWMHRDSFPQQLNQQAWPAAEASIAGPVFHTPALQCLQPNFGGPPSPSRTSGCTEHRCSSNIAWEAQQHALLRLDFGAEQGHGNSGGGRGQCHGQQRRVGGGRGSVGWRGVGHDGVHGSGQGDYIQSGRGNGGKGNGRFGYLGSSSSSSSSNNNNIGVNVVRSGGKAQRRGNIYGSSFGSAKGPGHGRRRIFDDGSESEDVLPVGLLPRQFTDLLFRDLTPEDYELLCTLDEGVSPKQTVSCAENAEKLLRKPTAEACAEEVCTICLLGFDGCDSAAELPCKHLFHRECVSKWLLECRRACPLCGVESNATEGNYEQEHLL